MKYINLLKDGFKQHFVQNTTESKARFLVENIFELAVEDDELSAFYCSIIIDVCKALLNRTTYDYIKDEQNYKYYILVLNLPFFKDIIEWGVSIRGAWFTAGIEPYVLTSCGLFRGEEQICQLEFLEDVDICEFIQDIIDFYEDKTII